MHLRNRDAVPDWPDGVPVLSKGKHRNPKKGACFMEYASYLAGERWSDHPACTHPLLAALARLVNDYTTDAGRARLAPLVPAVIGLKSYGDDAVLDATIALRAATTALPVAAAERQNVLAVSLINARGVLRETSGAGPPDLMRDSQRALAGVPHAEQWARRFIGGTRPSRKGFGRHAAPSTVRVAAQSIARGCLQSPDDLLYSMLAGAIDDCRTVLAHQNDHVRHESTPLPARPSRQRG
ncbi:MAG TPA: hypothetical protein VFZ37_04465 [Jiangellaceae bacterium]